MSGTQHAGTPSAPVSSPREGTRKGDGEKPLGGGGGQGRELVLPLRGSQPLSRPSGRWRLPLSRAPVSGAGKRNHRVAGEEVGGGGAGRGGGPRGGAAGLSPPPAPGPYSPAPARSQPPCASRWPHRPTMKALLFAVLAAVLCVERAHTLVCFSCSDASSNWACLTPVKCGENENHCVTTYVGVGLGSKSGQSISKGCSPICPSAGINLGIAAASVYCCDSFLCNISGSSSVKASYAVLALGVLVSFIYVLRARE
uniref:UPAR/Ly6 domain-containing protein n=3 Tax=Charadriiformes TaxID=8906 RepID=A0A8C3JSS1_9CHAR